MGSDELGEYNATRTTYTTTATLATQDIVFETLVKQYSGQPNVVVFEQHFPKGVASCALVDSLAQRDRVVSAFPSFMVRDRTPR